ncbi:MAG: TRAP transporter substrate-binding protein [Desulfobacterales bacterium]|nr:MAG: TRAP transporter substrate-binding protein [Desulfobacterales bacterium]
MKIQKMARAGLFVGLCLIFLTVFAVTAVEAAKKVRVATVALPETTIGQSLVKWKEVLEDRSGGELQVQILDRGVMGGDREMIEGCRLGTLDTAIVSGSVLANIIPQYFMIPLPYLFNNHEEADAFLDGPLGQKMFKMLEDKNLVGLGWATWSFRGIWNNVRPITQPEDLKGLKIRTVETPLDMDTINNMGGIATPMAWNEALLGMRQGTVDGISTTYGLGYHLKLYEIAKYATRTKHYYETAPLIMSKKLFDQFSPDEQEMIKASAAEALLWARKQQADFDDKSDALLEEKGVKVNSLSPEAFEAFRKLTRPEYEQFRPKIGAEFMDECMNFIEANRKK